ETTIERIQDAQRGGHDFGADAVPADHGDGLAHGELLEAMQSTPFNDNSRPLYRAGIWACMTSVARAVIQPFGQLPTAVGRHQIVIAAHVMIVDEDLRHAAPTAAAFEHFFTLGRVAVDKNLVPVQ